ncbi:MAG: iron ABC transporter substrate-binding protein [Alphaproteobacteria bacterium]|nr:MAG: iron ABC transporter substrate-binding protein [Alphaproteobacteria bacterium]
MKRRTFLGAAGAAATSTLFTPLATPALAAGTRTVTDVLGREVTVPMDPQRILLGFYFEDFWAIGGRHAYDRVVAISREAWEGWRNSQWQRYVAVEPRLERLVDVGEVDGGTFSIETAVAARPDVAILAAWQYKGIGDEGVKKLEAAGIPVVVADYNAQTVEKHMASTHMIGDLLGGEAEERGHELAHPYEWAVEDVRDRWTKAQAEGAKAPRVYLELGNKGPGEYGNSYGEGMWGGVIEAAGGINIARGQVDAWGPLNPEYVIASNPQAIFFAGSDWVNRPRAVLMGFGQKPETTRERMAAYLKRPGWSGLDAVKSGNVHAVYHGGTRTLYDFTYLQYIAKQLYPQAFADVDPLKNLQDYYKTYLPIEADGVFMLKL